jgi:hypothetical protein
MSARRHLPPMTLTEPGGVINLLLFIFQIT